MGEGEGSDRLFTGQRWDATIGLYDYSARFYDPYLNRWISPDTIIPDPTNPQNLNRFAYCRNNPLGYLDPSGHYSVEFENEAARRDFAERGWDPDNPEEFIEWVLSVLREGAAANPGGEIEGLLENWDWFDSEFSIQVTICAGGNPHGWMQGITRFEAFVDLPAYGVIERQHAFDRESPVYRDSVLPYATIVAHEFLHAVVQLPGVAPTTAGEREAHRFQHAVGQELGLDWGNDHPLAWIAASNENTEAAGYGGWRAELQWAVNAAARAPFVILGALVDALTITPAAPTTA